MDALLIKRQFLEKIFAGTKQWEIRGSATKKRGRIALVESGSGTVVGTCNLTVVALYACNIWWRHGSPTDLKVPFILSLVALGLLVVSGWLGGKMVYEAGVGVDTGAAADTTPRTTTGRPAPSR